jgi:tRNA threonylcarbamoyladenosine biosynthesis protein TsaE
MSESGLEKYLADEEATVQIGNLLGQVMQTGGVIYLEGDLGAGKTTLTRGLLMAFGHQGAVKSPTFTLVEPYEFANHRFYHFDLYRLGDPEELDYLGIRDYFGPGNLCAIEWPERGQGYLPTPDLRVSLSVQGAGRLFRLTACSPAGERAAARLISLV